MNENIRLPKIAIPHRYEINLDINLDEFTYAGKEVVFLEIVDETKELQLHSLGIEIENAFIENDSGEHIEASINYLTEEEKVSLIFEDKVTQGDWQLYLDFKATIVDELRGFTGVALKTQKIKIFGLRPLNSNQQQREWLFLVGTSQNLKLYFP